MRVTKVVITAAAFLLTATSVLALDKKPNSHDEQSKYIISAKSGVVSVAEGEVTVLRFRPFATPEKLLSDDQLTLNDRVRTGPNSRAEILLNPGCYLRLDSDSELVYLFDELDTNKIKLLRGSAIIEATVIDGLIFVDTPKTKFDIVWNGLYRFSVGADEKSEVAVRKGKVLVADTEIKEGKRAVAEESRAIVASLNKKETDEFDNWSKQRAQTLIAANRQLSRSGLRRSLRSSFFYNAWVYDPFCRCYTFLPYLGGFSSPYGWGYAMCNPYGSYLPSWYYHPRFNNGEWISGGHTNGAPAGGGTPLGGGGSSGGSGGGGGGGRPSPPPMHKGGGSVHNPSGSDRGLPSGGHERPAKP